MRTAIHDALPAKRTYLVPTLTIVELVVKNVFAAELSNVDGAELGLESTV